MNDRYSRQINLAEIGEEGQKKLRNAHIVIVGIGALGSVAAELLARAGIGRLTLIDFDVVELNNLARQALYDTEDVGNPKVDAAKKHIELINPEVEVKVVMEHLDKRNLALLDKADLILDGTDNMETRFLINEHCYGKIPIIFTSAVMDRGSVLPVTEESACYACLFGEKKNCEDCCTNGVINGATHLAATVSATEAIKHILGMQTIDGLFSFSLFQTRFDVLKTKKNPNCSICK